MTLGTSNSKFMLLTSGSLSCLIQTITTEVLATEMTIKDYYHYQKNRGGLKGISTHHWLVQQWIPSCCVLGAVTIENFEEFFRIMISDAASVSTQRDVNTFYRIRNY